MSGVGKSSLINSLIDNNSSQTSHISDTTGKGRHTTTRREMFLLASCGILIDTPGMREFGITSASNETLSEIFDLSDHEGWCQFNDCTHTSEPGCSILQAIEDRRISEDSYNIFLKLQRESKYYARSEHEKRRQVREFGRIVKEALTIKRSLK
ncbi:MAG: ribosome small subunit-dependent GTPase A [Bacteroidales bacterium]